MAARGRIACAGPGWRVHSCAAECTRLILAGVLVGHHDVDALIAVGCIAAALGARIVAEERAVARTYPEYASYAKRTKRIIPWVL